MTLPEPDVYSNRFDSGGDYVQLDRWNRPTTWTWTKDLTTDPHIDFYDVDIVYNKRGDIMRTIDNVMADTSGTHYFDRAFTLDALGRVLGETRGDWDGSAIDTTREERNWMLTAMGNWASRDIDLDGSGIDFAEDNLDPDLATRYSNAWFATACLSLCRLQFIMNRLLSDKDHRDSRRDRLRFQRQTRESWHTKH